MEECCFSPQSWAASPGETRRQQLFGSDSDSPSAIANPTAPIPRRDSFWKRLHNSVKKLGKKKK